MDVIYDEIEDARMLSLVKGSDAKPAHYLGAHELRMGYGRTRF
jgi:hypothetical protein